MVNDQRPKVTVYIPCRNYGDFLPEAIESVLAQTYERWELLVFDEASADETRDIIRSYADGHPDRIRVFFHEEAKGLQACANRALKEARGKYIMRLDADDYLDESALLVMATYLDEHPDVALVYPNYVYVDGAGRLLGIERRKKVPDEVKLLDLPAHGACTLVRRSTLRSVGGYNEDYECQDGYELWLKIFPRYQVGNISTPLFYYRQHGDSLSADEGRILDTRRTIKRELASKNAGSVTPEIVAIVPAKNTYEDLENIVLRDIAGQPLIDYTLETALEVPAIDRIFVSTDDPDVVAHCEELDGVLASMRPPKLSHGHNLHFDVIADAVRRLENDYKIHPDVIVDLDVNAPLRRAEHIQEAIDTLILYDADSVVSVYEDKNIHLTHGEYGLEPLNPHMRKRLVIEREALYTDNLAVKVYWRDVLAHGDVYGKKVGHIVMPEEDSFKIESEFEAKLVSNILEWRRNESRDQAAAKPGLKDISTAGTPEGS